MGWLYETVCNCTFGTLELIMDSFETGTGLYCCTFGFRFSGAFGDSILGLGLQDT